MADAAVRETIEQLEATGSPVITDGEQGKPSFATYPLAGLAPAAVSTPAPMRRPARRPTLECPQFPEEGPP